LLGHVELLIHQLFPLMGNAQQFPLSSLNWKP